jgi:hypothetical protein
MRSRSAALLVAGALALAGAATTTTRAMWSSAVALDAGTVTGGRLSLLVGAGGTAGETYTFDALSGSNLGPGSVRQAPLTVANEGTIALRYRSTGASFGALSGQATSTATLVASEAGCPASGAPVALPGDIAVPRTLAPGAQETWCIRVTLGPNPPQGLTNAPVVLGFTAEQDRHAG